jgi:predicted MPP superfamily phosphohydrolase
VGAFLAMYCLRHKTKHLKFRRLIPVALTIALIPIVHIVHALTLDKNVVYREIPFASENWPASLNGYRIGYMTDFHTITLEDMRGVVEELGTRNLDLLVLGGDFSMRDNHYKDVLEIISTAQTKDGIFGVEGNHDDHVRVFAAKETYGIVPLSNSGQSIHPNFFQAGAEDLWNRNPDIDEAIKDAKDEDFVLLLTHNPDITMTCDTTGVDLILSGHTHSGQITFFGWAFYLYRGSITDYGTRFDRGWAESRDGTPVYTSTGVGPYYTMPRVFSRPEVIIFTMNNE